MVSDAEILAAAEAWRDAGHITADELASHQTARQQAGLITARASALCIAAPVAVCRYMAEHWRRVILNS